jgi:hypothetical protein
LNSWEADPSKYWKEFWEGLANILDKKGRKRIKIIKEN